MKTTKHIFFNTKDEAERFEKLYDNKIDWVCIDLPYDNYWIRTYFGPNALGKVHVYFRTDTENLNKIIKAIGLKKKKWAGHLCYLFEG